MDLVIENAIQKMRPPSAMTIIDIDITNKCDLACSNCTRLLENQESHWEMSPDNFRMAVRSLRDFNGVIAVIGGNPCMHSKFPEICRIFQEEIPNKDQRGLWTNNLFKHFQIAKETFGTGNFNAHGVDRGIRSINAFYKAIGNSGGLMRGYSHHSPILTAIKDLYDTNEMWDRISKCEINHEWSASIIENKGQLRAYFCEIAAAFDLANGTDYGFEVTDGWWQKPLNTFTEQITHFCPNCGVAAKLKGHMDHEEIDTFTISNIHLVNISLNKKRKTQYVDRNFLPKPNALKVTQYNEAHIGPMSIFDRLYNGVKNIFF